MAIKIQQYSLPMPIQITKNKMNINIKPQWKSENAYWYRAVTLITAVIYKSVFHGFLYDGIGKKKAMQSIVQFRITGTGRSI
jgi:hypothetical protein